MWGATSLNACSASSRVHFNPRTPCGVRPDGDVGAALIVLFQSTHPVWGATGQGPAQGLQARISIHAPRVGCDPGPCTHPGNRQGFQSTHPVWGATSTALVLRWCWMDFNPRTPCGVRPAVSRQIDLSILFQSTHPVWGATTNKPISGGVSKKFQSTHPVWGATS